MGDGKRKHSSVGRASALQAEGHRFEPYCFHQKTTPRAATHIPRGFSSFGRARPCQGRGGGFEPRNPLQKKNPLLVSGFFFWTYAGSNRGGKGAAGDQAA